MNNNELEKYRMLHKVLTEKKEQDPVGKAMGAMNITQSNNVVVNIGTYKKEEGVLENITYEGNYNADHIKYMDIETSQIYKVPLCEVEEFEKTHKVIKRKVYAANIPLYINTYNAVRREFFEGVLDDTQESVILSLVNNENK